MLLDVETGVMQFVESDPEREVDFGGTIFHPDTARAARHRLRRRPRARLPQDRRRARRSGTTCEKTLPDGEISRHQHDAST